MGKGKVFSKDGAGTTGYTYGKKAFRIYFGIIIRKLHYSKCS